MYILIKSRRIGLLSKALCETYDRTAEPRGYSQSNNDRRDLAAYNNSIGMRPPEGLGSVYLVGFYAFFVHLQLSNFF